MLTRRLDSISVEQLHSTFVAAFADYVIPMKPTLSELEEMLRRRGFDPAMSVGVFDHQSLVAFTLNAIGTWGGLPCGYDAGTGVIASHRRQGLARAVMIASMDVCRERGLSAYVLEVIRENSAAVSLYRALGFEHTRDLRCFVVDDFKAGSAVPYIVKTGVDETMTLACAWSQVRPSWQNSGDSIRRSGGAREVLVVNDTEERPAGLAVVYATGDVPLLAVRPELRGRGIGLALLKAARGKTQRPLRFINVDAGAADAIRFLERHGGREIVVQHEMTLRL